MSFEHTPVLLGEAIDALKIRKRGVYVDGTVGEGGHAYEICKRLGDTGRLVGMDKDGEAVKAARERLFVFGQKATVIRSDYRDIKARLSDLGIERVDGILLDLGVSSCQLNHAQRGFSYLLDGPLDMRMDDRQKRTARDIVNGYTEEELCRVIREYGEERFAKNIARHIAFERRKGPIETTAELNKIIQTSIPIKAQKTSGHPSKRTFQALRIEVNGELDALQNSLDEMINLLTPGGRICVISFHSLEDRIVKNIFRRSENPCIYSKDFPICVCKEAPKGKVITKKPILPTKEERERNRRSKSAKMRVFERA